MTTCTTTKCTFKPRVSRRKPNTKHSKYFSIHDLKLKTKPSGSQVLTELLLCDVIREKGAYGGTNNVDPDQTPRVRAFYNICRSWTSTAINIGPVM